MQARTVRVPSHLARHIIAFAFLAGIAQAAHAQYTTRAMRVLVPFPAGSATDTSARILAAPLAQALGQPIIVEDRAGADGATGAVAAARAAPDRHAVFLATNSAMAAVRVPYEGEPQAVTDLLSGAGVEPE